MKKFATITIAIIIAVVAIFVVFQKNYNRMNADSYYTQIVGDGKLLADEDPDYNRYEYTLQAFSANKNESFTFTATKQLRKGAYLRLYVKGDKGVSSYEEVAFDKIPKDLQHHFKH